MADTTPNNGPGERRPSSRVDRRIDVLLDAIADTNANVNKLVTLMDRHLRFDHGYGDDTD